MEQKEIAIFGPSKRFLSGVSYYTIRLSNALSEFFKVKAVLFRRMLPKRLFPGWKRVGEELTKLEFNENVKVYEILDWYNLISWLKAYRIARKCNAVIFEWWTSSVAHMYLAIALLNRKGIPIILEFHEVVDPLENAILPIRLYSRVMGKLIRSFASHYVAHSEADRNTISKIYKIPKEKISVIPHGLYDHYERVENAKAILGIKENFVILFFGLIRPYKGLRYLIDAFEALPEEIAENSRLLIVGEAWEDRESLRLAMSSGRREKITIVNRYVPDSEVSLYFSASDVLVLPYTRASQSGVAHIGMHFGIPIIATEVGGLKESLSEYSGSIFVDANAGSIAEALGRVYSERRKFEAPERLKWKNIAEEWIKVIEDRIVEKNKA
ncbi:MAG: glycosyltransferase [Candidatus Methanoglobus sp.]